MKTEDEIRALEEKLLQPDFRRNRAAVAALLADDFREFGSSGRIWTKQQILDHLESEAPFEAEMRDFDATELAPGIILATYKVTVKNRTSLRSSIWINRDSRWQLLFHQGTITRSWSDYLNSDAVASSEFMQDVEDPPPQDHEEWMKRRSTVTKAAIDEALRILHRETGAAPEPGDELPKGYRRRSSRKL